MRQRLLASFTKKFSMPTYAIESAMAGSTNRGLGVKIPSVAIASVIECATVNAVTTARSSLSRARRSTRPSRNTRWS